MTDIHCHILFGLDDGSYSISESIELLKKMVSIGFKNIILTPHYIKGSEYNADNKRKMKNFLLLKEMIKKEGIDVNIFLGNEIFITDNILELIKDNKISSLNNTKYLLIELPFNNPIINVEDIIYEIKLKGYIPVIAHPERYRYFQDDYLLVDKLKGSDVLFQCNYSSILGYYGKSALKLVKYMYKKDYVNYLGTDIHHINNTYVIDNFDKIKKKIIKNIGEDKFKEIILNCNNLITMSRCNDEE